MIALTFRTGSVSVNDVFVSSWGWEQTNVNFYQVISIHGKKTVVIREIRGACYSDGMTGSKKAVLNDFIGEPIKRQVKDNSHRPTINIDDCECAYKSEPGKNYSFTSYA